MTTPKGRHPKPRGVRPAKASRLRPGPRGQRRSADTTAGRVVDSQGPEPLVSALVRALRARGEIDRVTQRFHAYPARMHPDAARELLAILPGERVLDPFCGGGTVLVEVMLAGRHARGRDLNPVAVAVAHARTRLMSKADIRALRSSAERIARIAADIATSAVPPTAVASLSAWYGRRALGELSALHALIEDAPAAERALLRAVHSSLVVKYSRRASDTSARRVDDVPARGAVLKAFRARAVELTRMLGELAHDVPPGTRPAEVVEGDARAIAGEAELICTSPPYPGTYDYLAMQHQRLAWLGALEAMKSLQRHEIGARRDFRRSAEDGYARWQTDNDAWLAAAARVLVPGGHLAIMTGDGISHELLLETRAPTLRGAAAADLEMAAAVSIERVDPGTQLAKREHALVLRKR